MHTVVTGWLVQCLVSVLLMSKLTFPVGPPIRMCPYTHPGLSEMSEKQKYDIPGINQAGNAVFTAISVCEQMVSTDTSRF